MISIFVSESAQGVRYLLNTPRSTPGKGRKKRARSVTRTNHGPFSSCSTLPNTVEDSHRAATHLLSSEMALLLDSAEVASSPKEIVSSGNCIPGEAPPVIGPEKRFDARVF
ncbi:hypothetical protein RRG08_059211 [Elysia crispata]|uniref:Uncharacterized protein n=1 Tax=Elysia crispata TaxID=231223 RepID=A0AAE1DEU5_9GAST|nr:hypothetical protein RRG08_059211 [Elysia crispata]